MIGVRAAAAGGVNGMGARHLHDLQPETVLLRQLLATLARTASGQLPPLDLCQPDGRSLLAAARREGSARR